MGDAKWGVTGAHGRSKTVTCRKVVYHKTNYLWPSPPPAGSHARLRPSGHRRQHGNRAQCQFVFQDPLAMSRTQRRAIWTGVTLIVLMGVIPPWAYRGGSEGYSLIFHPPNNYSSIDVTRLLIQWMIVSVVMIARVLTAHPLPQECVQETKKERWKSILDYFRRASDALASLWWLLWRLIWCAGACYFFFRVFEQVFALPYFAQFDVGDRLVGAIALVGAGWIIWRLRKRNKQV